METNEKSVTGIFNSTGFKLGLIAFLTLLLLIPTNMILNLIREREQRKTDTVNEITSLWGNAQTVAGPVLTVPYVISQKEGNKVNTTTRYAHFLPEKLLVQGEIIPEKRKRGIYTVITYVAKLHVTGNFPATDLTNLDLPSDATAKQASLDIGITDMRGINKDILIKWGSATIPVIPGTNNKSLSESGVHANISPNDNGPVKFSYDIDLAGSESMNFIPLGKETNVDISSKWTTPSFSGAFLPDERNVNENGFTATWNVLQLNRNFPQQWINDQYSVEGSSFGVQLLTPVDTYQKSERSVKYAILFIGLTFLVFFFAEVMTGIRMHPVNYLLSGFALCIFYSLLTALAEQMSFNLAYLISGTIIVIMIGTFTHSLYKKWQVSATVIVSLIALYTFLFIILQLMDYSLLFGNIGLVIILAIVMYFSRKIDWYSTSKRTLNN